MGGVSARTATRLAWSLWVACVVLITLALLLDFATPESILIRTGERSDPVLDVLMGLLSLAYPTVGALIASRLPTNPIGWIFCGAGLLYETQRFFIAYADYALIENFEWPGGVRGLVLDVGRVSRASPGGSVSDALVPQWPATVSPLADRGMGGGLRSRVGRTRGRVYAGTVAHSLLR
jgi:hypothetical protein